VADKTTTTFNKVGTGMGSDFVDLTSIPSRNTTARPRGGGSTTTGPVGMIGPATARVRPTIPERLGAQLHPTAVLYRQNAAEAGMTQRNVRLVPSAVGNRDFYLRRQYGQGV
jgi:hypothetical protein